jgi:2-polyprenyl-3-methyl-5-hydroxy-6-metoxy-1,4-benzoquinol methylase
MADYFDQYSEDYIQLLSKSVGVNSDSADFFAAQKLLHVSRFLEGRLKIASVLDYGCGVGLSLPSLQQCFPQAQITGVDQSEESITVAKKRMNDDMSLRLASVSAFLEQHGSERYDLIYVSCVLHHVDEAEHVNLLAFLRERCSRNGYLAVAEHNPYNPITQRIVRNCPFDEGVTLLSSRRLKQSLIQAGWLVTRKINVSFVPPSLKMLRGLERVLTWLPAGAQYILMAQPSED